MDETRVFDGADLLTPEMKRTLADNPAVDPSCPCFIRGSTAVFRIKAWFVETCFDETQSGNIKRGGAVRALVLRHLRDLRELHVQAHAAGGGLDRSAVFFRLIWQRRAASWPL